MTRKLTVMTNVDTNVDGAIDHLNRVIAARGRGGGFSVAVDLGVDPSQVSHWRRGKRVPSPDMTRKINGLPVIDNHDGDKLDTDHDKLDTDHDKLDTDHDNLDADHDSHDANPDSHDANPDNLDAPDPVRIGPESMADLEAAVLGATPQDVIEVGSADLDTGPALPAPSSEWRDNVWLFAHDMIAAYVGPPRGPLIAKHARSAHGTAACEASERVAHRMGLDNLMRSGHWTVDLAIMASYAITVLKITKGPDEKQEVA
ncbi:helix-turn-helix domain-containing protein [Ruegeria sp.]|uniref:helix-turn-helix domain-containing protein n=1 Tax=Ruegeria sp. TaxID=1879320 RepID=UPI003C7C6064